MSDEQTLLQVQIDVAEGSPSLLAILEKCHAELTDLRSHLELAVSVCDASGESDRPVHDEHSVAELSALAAEAHIMHRRLTGILDATSSRSVPSAAAGDELLQRAEPRGREPPIAGKAAARWYQNQSTLRSGDAADFVEADPVSLDMPGKKPWPDILGEGQTARSQDGNASKEPDPKDLTDPWPAIGEPVGGDEPSFDKGNFSGSDSRGAGYVKGGKGGSPWIIVAVLTLFVVIIGSLVVIVSPMHVDEHGKVSKSEPSDAKLKTGLRSRFLQVSMPFWVPTPPDSCGLSFVVYFCGALSTGASLCFWIAYASVVVARNIMPFAVKPSAGTVGHGWLGSVPLRIITLVGIGIMPLMMVCRWKDFKGRSLQWFQLSTVLFLILLQNSWHVAQTFISRIFMDAIFFSDEEIFWKSYWVQVGGLVFSCMVLMLSRYLQARLGLNWRQFMTNHFLDLYLNRRSYYAIDALGREGERIDNPDQRIQEDASQISSGLVAFVLDLFNSFVALLSFATILWTLKKSLTLVAVGYSLIGSLVAMLIAWRLVIINYVTQRSEADFRFSLVHVRNNPEAIAFYGGEAREKKINQSRLEVVISMLSWRIRWDTLAEGFVSVYTSFGVTIPSILLFEDFLQGDLDFGALTQAVSAFTTMLHSLSFVVANLQTITSLSTAGNRLGSLMVLLRRPEEVSEIEIVTGSDACLEVSNLTANIPGLGKYVVRGLSLQGASNSARGPTRLLLVGPSGVGKSSVLRVVAGLWRSGQGSVTRPPNAECLFLPQKPYMPLGDLRTQLVYPDEQDGPAEAPSSEPYAIKAKGCSDAELRTLLGSVGLDELPERLPEGFGGTCDWSRVLSVGEQQRLASLRIFLRQPKLTILDEATSALTPLDEARLYERLMGAGLSYVSVGHRDSLIKYHDKVLELRSGGEWKIHTAKEYADSQAMQKL